MPPICAPPTALLVVRYPWAVDPSEGGSGESDGYSEGGIGYRSYQPIPIPAAETIGTTVCTCANNCPQFSSDGVCDDGGPNMNFNECAYGSDCADCGERCNSPVFPPPPPFPPGGCPAEHEPSAVRTSFRGGDRTLRLDTHSPPPCSLALPSPVCCALPLLLSLCLTRHLPNTKKCLIWQCLERKYFNEPNPREDNDCCGPGWFWNKEGSKTGKTLSYQKIDAICKPGYAASMGPVCFGKGVRCRGGRTHQCLSGRTHRTPMPERITRLLRPRQMSIRGRAVRDCRILPHVLRAACEGDAAAAAPAGHHPAAPTAQAAAASARQILEGSPLVIIDGA